VGHQVQFGRFLATGAEGASVYASVSPLGAACRACGVWRQPARLWGVPGGSMLRRWSVAAACCACGVWQPAFSPRLPLGILGQRCPPGPAGRGSSLALRPLCPLCPPCRPQVLEKTATTVTCKALNSAVLDGLLTVMICHADDEQYEGDYALPLFTEQDADCIRCLGCAGAPPRARCCRLPGAALALPFVRPLRGPDSGCSRTRRAFSGAVPLAQPGQPRPPPPPVARRLLQLPLRGRLPQPVVLQPGGRPVRRPLLPRLPRHAAHQDRGQGGRWCVGMCVCVVVVWGWGVGGGVGGGGGAACVGLLWAL
jgi:hypothetical protein